MGVGTVTYIGGASLGPAHSNRSVSLELKKIRSKKKSGMRKEVQSNNTCSLMVYVELWVSYNVACRLKGKGDQFLLVSDKSFFPNWKVVRLLSVRGQPQLEYRSRRLFELVTLRVKIALRLGL
jgi:hypothetical protein